MVLGAGSCRLPPGHQPNPLNLTTKGEARYKARSKAEEKEKEEVGKRAKREVERVVPAEQVVEEGELRRVVRLDCNRGTAKCLAITCQVSTSDAPSSPAPPVLARCQRLTIILTTNLTITMMLVKRWKGCPASGLNCFPLSLSGLGMADEP